MPSVVPGLMRAMYTVYTDALTEINVQVGTGVDSDPRDRLMIGVDDIDGLDWANSADSNQEWVTVGQDMSREERGTITCAALATIGDVDMLDAIDRVHAINAEIEAIHRPNYTLGVAGVLWTEFGGNAATRVLETEFGSYALLVFQVGYVARI